MSYKEVSEMKDLFSSVGWEDCHLTEHSFTITTGKIKYVY